LTKREQTLCSMNGSIIMP